MTRKQPWKGTKAWSKGRNLGGSGRWIHARRRDELLSRKSNNTLGIHHFEHEATLQSPADTEQAEEYTVQYLTFFSGLRIGFSKPERLLSSVELLVTWSEDELKNTFGEKFKRRTVGNQKILEFPKLPTGRQMVAILDGNGNVRSVKFTKVK